MDLGVLEINLTRKGIIMNKYFYLWSSLIIVTVFPIYAQEHNNLKYIIEIERNRLEESINSEINVILDIAESLIINRYLSNPSDITIKELAMEEIASSQRNLQSQFIFWVSDIDKMFYYDRDNYYIIDPEDPYNYWYYMTLYETDVYNSIINYNPILDQMYLWINVPVFSANRQPIGIIGTSIDLSYLINNIYTNYLGDEEIYLFNSYGEITGARNMALIRNRVNIIRVLGQTGENILSIARDLNDYEICYLNITNSNVAIGKILTIDWYIIAIKED
jgi:methyl-accepting chemotaxis protein